MKKVITTITAVAFALGLASAGLAQQTKTDTPEKPAVKQEAPVAQPAAQPESKSVTKPEPKAGAKAKEAPCPAGKAGDKGKQSGKKAATTKPVTQVEKSKSEAKPGAPAAKPKDDKQL